MKLLHKLMTRRTFLQLSAALSVVAARWRPKGDANSRNQNISQARGYGVGVYGEASYPGTTNKSYLPFIRKE